MQSIIDQTISAIDGVLDHVASILPPDFPENIAGPIFDGMKRCVKKL